MQQVERHIKIGSSELEAICAKSKRLYNYTLYHLRHVLFGKVQKFSEYEMTGLMAEFDQPDYRELPAQTAQQIVKLAFKNWKSYWAALKEYKKHPEKFKGRPRLPKYKESQFVFVLTGQQVKIKDGYIHFPKNTIAPIKTNIGHNKICQVRITPQASCHIIEVVYEKEITDVANPKENVLSLDIGLDNLVAGITNVGHELLRPFLVNGKSIKSFNQWYNKLKAKLTSHITKGGREIYSSHRLDALNHYRNCWIEDKMHKVSSFIADYCIKHKIGTVVVGKNENWKQEINIGKKNNQHFVSIPHAKLIDKIKYKLELLGITFILQEESYTSKCDHLAGEAMKHQQVYLGKRKRRGLFQSSTGFLLNADINGAIGIGLKAKVFGNDFVRSLLDSRIAFMPYRISVL